MKRDELETLLRKIRSVKIAVIGDFCIDAYWILDTTRSDVSVESGRPTVPVREQTYSLGGAGNIVQNLEALHVSQIYAAGVIGDDLFGRELVRLLGRHKTDTSAILTQEGSWATPVYGKPFQNREEQARLDFGMWNELDERTEVDLLQHTERILESVQALIINQQLAMSIYSHRVLKGLNRLAENHNDKIFLVDSRNKSRAFNRVIHRFNEREAAAHCTEEVSPSGGIARQETHRFAERIHKETQKPVFISRGEHGGVVYWDKRIDDVDGIQTGKETDSVGAGDTADAALAAALAAGATPLQAAELANLAAAVTVQKIRMTGTASPEEILQLFEQTECKAPSP